MKKMNSLLDERQEADMLKIERTGCWLAFWGLLIAMMVQLLFLEDSFDKIAGEWIVFMVLALYLTFAALHKGIWSRNYRADFKTILVFSAAASAVMMVFFFFTIYRRTGGSVRLSLLSALVGGVFAFVLLILTLSVCAAAYKKRQAQLDKEPEGPEEDL